MTGVNEKQIGGEHYLAMDIQVWDFVTVNKIPYLEGNAIKYIARWRSKGGLADLDKAIHYIEKIKSMYTKKEGLTPEQTEYMRQLLQLGVHSNCDVAKAVQWAHNTLFSLLVQPCMKGDNHGTQENDNEAMGKFENGCPGR